MPNASPDLLIPSMHRIRQIDDNHCGPAVLEMLMSFYNLIFSQQQIVHTAGIEKKILTHGMFIEEMGLALQRLAPYHHFWFKRGASLSELSQLVQTYGYPVGVEWQGIFEHSYFDPDYSWEDDEEEDEDDNGAEDIETGHYSVVTGISTSDNWITLADPYHNLGVDRYMTILEFERRWWDINEVINPVTGKRYQQDDYHALFLITPKEITLPDSLGLSLWTETSMGMV